MAPKVTVILLNWNNLTDTLICLKSIHHLKYSQIDTIVIDNGSKEDPGSILERDYPGITYIKNQSNLGYTGGNNIGMEIALSKSADYVWLLNNDTYFNPYTLSSMIDVAESSKTIGIVSPIIIQTSNNNRNEYLGTYINIEKFIKRDIANREELNRIETHEPERISLWGTSILVNRRLLETIGYLDERFFAYYEDMDYSLRSIKSGFLNKVAINAIVNHRHRSEIQEGIPDYYYYYMARNEYLFWEKHTELKDIGSLRLNYMKKVIRKAAGLKEKSQISSAQACLDGMWCAFKNQYGVKNQCQKMPNIIQNLILWHPYFLCDLLPKL